MVNELNCWEINNCNQYNCPVYGLKDGKCWLILDTLCYGQMQSDYTEKLETCLKCKFFNKNLNLASAKELIEKLKVGFKQLSKKLAPYDEQFHLQLLNIDSKDKFGTKIDVLNTFIDFLPEATLMIDENKKVIIWNKSIEKLTGFKKDEIMYKGDYIYSIPFYGYKRPMLVDLLDNYDEYFEKQYEHIERKENFIYAEMYIPSLGKNGKEAYLWAIASFVYDENGKKLGAIETIRDITDYKTMEKMLIDINDKLRIWANELEQRNRELAILNQTTEKMQICINITECLDIIVETMQKLFPYASGSLYVYDEFSNSLKKTSRWGERNSTKNNLKLNDCIALKQNRIYISELTNKNIRCKHLSRTFLGNYICIPLIAQKEIIGLLYLEFDKDQNLIGDIEIAESKTLFLNTLIEHFSLSLYNTRLRESLRNQAIRDPLTNLFNRRYMEETLIRELKQAQRKRSSLGLIMFDIDHFKKFNDTYGHSAGDTMLKAIAAFAKSYVREEDVVSRYGGEEFLIIMPNADLKTTYTRAEKMRQEVKNLMIKHQNQLLGTISLSFGVACSPEHAKNWESLIKAADDALYRAKAAGRDKVMIAEKN
ncbi:MAG: diguanylate cyclase [Thermodesulfovibrionales bacterium]|nr:diguanylate cyclase [Thermodesulfovibrionales bacterium]